MPMDYTIIVHVRNQFGDEIETSACSPVTRRISDLTVPMLMPARGVCCLLQANRSARSRRLRSTSRPFPAGIPVGPFTGRHYQRGWIGPVGPTHP